MRRMTDLLRLNLLSPLSLAFALGVVAKLARSELALPKDLYASLSIYLLFAIGLKGGVELSHTTLASIARPAAVTLLLGCLTPASARWIPGLSSSVRSVGMYPSAGVPAKPVNCCAAMKVTAETEP